MLEEMSDESYVGDEGVDGLGEVYEGAKHSNQKEFDDTLAGVSGADDDPILPYLKKTNEGLIYCTECEYKSDRNDSIRTHVEGKHLNIAYPCNICPYVTNTKEYIRRHMRQKHKNGQGQQSPIVQNKTNVELL